MLVSELALPGFGTKPRTMMQIMVVIIGQPTYSIRGLTDKTGLGYRGWSDRHGHA